MKGLELSTKTAARLKAPLAHVLAFEEVESSGLGFWDIGGEHLPSIRHESHHFGACTHYEFNATHPEISSRGWDASLAAKTWAGAWAQHREAAALNKACADSSASWGKYQVMGFNWRGLKYDSLDQFVAGMSTEEGQAEAFARFIEADPVLHRAMIKGDWGTVESRYNGGGFGGAYAVKMRRAAERYAAPGPAKIGPRILREGDQGDDVAELQLALEAHGHELGTVDGQFGPATAAAVKAFQAANGLVADGLAGPMTKSWLGLIR